MIITHDTLESLMLASIQLKEAGRKTCPKDNPLTRSLGFITCEGDQEEHEISITKLKGSMVLSPETLSKVGLAQQQLVEHLQSPEGRRKLFS